MRITAVLDPGIRGCGVAIFHDQTLHKCAYIPNTATCGQRISHQLEMAGEVIAYIWKCDTLVIEWPQVYARDVTAKRSNANDLLPLCGIGAAVAMGLRPGLITDVKPAQWKGQLKKDVGNDRVIDRLGKAEKLLIPTGRFAHNAIDAVGIGLWALGRFNRKRVYARG